jgi:N12 class adenine-specific DNA methylase
LRGWLFRSPGYSDSEFLKLYPRRGSLSPVEHFAAGNRERAMARIASGNYDAVIVSHRSFEFLPVSDRLFNRFIDRQLDQFQNAIYEVSAETGDNRRIVKEPEKSKKRLATKLKQRAGRERKDNTISFEELGVDQIFVDEADLYKNLFYTSKMNRIALGEVHRTAPLPQPSRQLAIREYLDPKTIADERLTVRTGDTGAR